MLNNLWNISKQEAEETVDALWAYGLVQFTDITISPDNIKERCVEVHDVISQYVIEFMDSNEAAILSPVGGKLNTAESVGEGLTLAFQKSLRIHDLSSLTVMDYLKYKLNEIENNLLSVYLKTINMLTVNEPHYLILLLQDIKDVLMRLPQTINLPSLLGEEINMLQKNSKELLTDVHILCRKLNQRIQRNLSENNYDELIQTVEEFIKNYPLCSVAQKAVTMVKRIIPYCDGELLHRVTFRCEELQTMTCDYHNITISTLPRIKLHIKLHKQITDSLLKGLPDILLYNYFMSGKYHEEIELVYTNQVIKLQEVAPNRVKHLQKVMQQ